MGQISIGGQQVITNGNQFSISGSGIIGIGTSSPASDSIMDVEGSGNVIFDSGPVGIGADPSTEVTNTFSEAPLFIAEPASASIRLMTTSENDSYTTSSESIDFTDGPGNEFLAEIAALNADYPTGGGLYRPRQLAIWAGQPGGILFLARSWPGPAGPIIFADGDSNTGEVMRIATNDMVGVGGETSPANLMSIKGNASVGGDYSETEAPTNGMIVEGKVGIGAAAPHATLDVNGSSYMRGTVIVTGTMVSGTVVASGTNLVLIPQQGDLSMGSFTAGATPQ